MRAVAAGVGLLVSSLGGPGQAFGACDPEREICSPLVACIEETGEIFRGASFGPEAGRIEVESDRGARCTGTWRRTALGIGLAQFDCDDGRAGASAFTWFEPETGTAVGQGTFEDGAVARFWSGYNLERYFREIDPAERLRMICTPGEMLLSGGGVSPLGLRPS